MVISVSICVFLLIFDICLRLLWEKSWCNFGLTQIANYNLSCRSWNGWDGYVFKSFVEDSCLLIKTRKQLAYCQPSGWEGKFCNSDGFIFRQVRLQFSLSCLHHDKAYASTCVDSLHIQPPLITPYQERRLWVFAG